MNTTATQERIIHLHPLLKWASFKIISVLFLIIYSVILACSYEQRSAHWIITTTIFVGLSIGTYACIIYSCSNSYTSIEIPEKGKKYQSLIRNKWFWILSTSIGISCIALSLILYTPWLCLDDFLFCGVQAKSPGIAGDWDAAVRRYSTWVARFGDFFNTLVSLSESRAIVWVVNPLLVSSIPFALFLLFRKSRTDSMFNAKGFLFYWFTFFLFILCNVKNWTPFWNYAAATNYLWPSIGFIWLLSCYNPVNWIACSKRQNELLTIGVFILAFICGWGMECTAVTIVPLLVVWGIYNRWRKIKIPTFCQAGILGALWGVFVLFSSPAHANRIKVISKSRKLDVSSMTPEQVSDFVENLSWDKVNLLLGTSGNISLEGIPLHQHLYFLPYIWERFWDAAIIQFVIVFILSVSMLLSENYRKSLKSIIISILLICVSCIMATSYLVAAIPTMMSFLPCAFLVASAGALLYYSHSAANAWSTRQVLAVIAITLFSLLIFVPAGVEAWNLLPYRDAHYAEIKRQQSNGAEHIVLPYPFPPKMENSLNIIRGLSIDARTYPNPIAARYYGVKSIRIKEQKKVQPKINAKTPKPKQPHQ